MDEQEFLHRISVDTNVNIELLKDLIHDDKLLVSIKTGKTMDAIMRIRSIQARVGLREAQMIVQAFSAELK
jgi:hypothetical protein